MLAGNVKVRKADPTEQHWARMRTKRKENSESLQKGWEGDGENVKGLPSRWRWWRRTEEGFHGFNEIGMKSS
jgi:hypothetical protein